MKTDVFSAKFTGKYQCRILLSIQKEAPVLWNTDGRLPQDPHKLKLFQKWDIYHEAWNSLDGFKLNTTALSLT